MRLQLSFEDFPIAHPWGVKLSFNYGQEQQRFAKKEPVWWNTTYLSISWMLWSEHRQMWGIWSIRYKKKSRMFKLIEKLFLSFVSVSCLVCTATQLITQSSSETVWNSTETWNTLSAFFHPDILSSVLTRKLAATSLKGLQPTKYCVCEYCLQVLPSASTTHHIYLEQ